MAHEKFPLGLLLLIVAAFTLSGCLRPASLPTVDLSRFTPQVGTSSSMDGQSPAVTATPKLDSATQNVLRIYPLWVGSTWVYEYLGYTWDAEVLWRVTETVVDSQIVDGHYVARVERTVELEEGHPEDNFPYMPGEGTYYYLIDGTDIYQFKDQVGTDLTNAWLDLVIPFPGDDVWYPDPAARAESDPPQFGYRFASAPYDQGLPEDGTVHICYNVATRIEAGKNEGTFCEGVGYVYQEATVWNTGIGFMSELVGFSLQ